MLFDQLKKNLSSTLKKFNWTEISFELWVSKNVSNAHFMSNILLLIAQKYNLKIVDIFPKISSFLLKNYKELENITLQNGFLNLFVKKFFLNNIIQEILLKKNDFGRLFLDEKVVHYEWVSANPTGYLHLGHARNVFVGQAITKILAFVGYRVVREFYINDHGNQIYQLGRSVFFHYQKLLGLNPSSFSELYLNKEVEFAAQKALKIFGKTFSNVSFIDVLDVQKKFILFAKDFFLNKMKVDLNSFGVTFDVWFSEKTLYQNNNLKHFIERLKLLKAVYSKEGALWFQATKYGSDQDFVLIKSNQLPTYFTGDIMYHNHKFTRGYDQYIDLFGVDHHSHYLKIKSGLKALGWDVNKFNVDLLQMVKIVQDGKTLKISKRKGTATSLIELVKVTGLDFLRFMLVSRQKQTKFVFDLNLIHTNNSQNPFFYVQYAYARSCQLLKKVSFDNKECLNDYSGITSIYEQNLILSLHQFKIFLKNAAVLREPQILVSYALNLSKNFHILYEKVTILNINLSLQNQRLQLIQAFQQVLKNTLDLLDIKPKSRM